MTTRHLLLTDRGDLFVRALVDGCHHRAPLAPAHLPPTPFYPGMRAHYSRKTPGSLSVTRNGEVIVLRTQDGFFVYIAHRPSPGAVDDKGNPITRMDKLEAWENVLCRNENRLRGQWWKTLPPHQRKHFPRYLRTSDLIREAVVITSAIWGPTPRDGYLTFIKPEALTPDTSTQVGRCYLEAGWTPGPPARDGKPSFYAPRIETPESWRQWQWADDVWTGERGGELRKRLAGTKGRRHAMPRDRRGNSEAPRPDDSGQYQLFRDVAAQ
jgi:hypothetical protein